MKTYLFIGGTADGSRIKTSGASVIKLSVAPNVPMLFQGAAQKFDYPIHEETYNLQVSADGENLYLYDKLRSRDIVKLLVAGYSKQP